MPRRTSSSVITRWTVQGVSDQNLTMSGLSGALVAPLHRQYKTARTETRYHLLLKTRQMITQTSASRGYVVFSELTRGTHKILKFVCGLRTHHVEYSKLGKTQMIEDVRRGMVRNTGFCAFIPPLVASEALIVSASHNKTYPVLKCKARGRQSFL